MSTFTEIETLKQRLVAERIKLLDICQTLSADEMLLRDGDAWSIRDILAHLAYAEKINVKFARLMLEMDQPKQIQVVAADYPDYVGAFELDRFNAYMMEKLRAQSFDADVMQSLTETRSTTLAWLDSLTPQDLDRQGEHAAWGDQTVRGMIKILLLHDKLHAQEIAKRLHAKGRGG